MSFDLALSENFDLVVSAAHDLAGTGGNLLIAQRIKTRLRIERGTWVLDDEIGSIMTSSLARITSENLQTVETIIRNALTPMDDISVTEVQVEKLTETQVLATIFFMDIGDTGPRTVNMGSDQTAVIIGISQTEPEGENAA